MDEGREGGREIGTYGDREGVRGRKRTTEIQIERRTAARPHGRHDNILSFKPNSFERNTST